MSAGEFFPTLRFRELWFEGAQIDWVSDTVRWHLVKASLTAYVDAQHLADLGYLGSISAEVAEVDSADTGLIIGTKSVTLSGSAVVIKGGTVVASSTAGGATARFAVLTLDGANEASTLILGILDLGSARALTGAGNTTPLTISFTDNKILKFRGTGDPSTALG